MDSYGGTKAKRPKRAVKRKMKTKVKIVVREDALGKYILFQGKKYRIGKDVDPQVLAEFVVNKGIKEPAKALKEKRKGRLGQIKGNLNPPAMGPLNYKRKGRVNASQPIDSYLKHSVEEMKQRERDKKEEEVREKLKNEELKATVHKVRVNKTAILEGKLRRLLVPDLKVLAKKIWKNNPALGVKRPPTRKEELITYIIDNGPGDVEFEQTPPSASVPAPVPASAPTSAPASAPVPRPSPSLSPVPPRAIIQFEDDDDPLELHPENDNERKEEYERAPTPTPRSPSPEHYQPYNQDDLNALSIPEIVALIRQDNPDAEVSASWSRPRLYDYILKKGQGKISSDLGLSNFDIDKVMKPYSEYLGTISHDQVKSQIIPKVKPKSRGGFIINTDPIRKRGEHWQAVFFDARPKGDHEIDFYDSYGDQIDPSLQRDLLNLAKKLNAGTYLKLKENRVRQQDAKSSNCGWFSIKFLMDRFRGRHFTDASGWNDSIKGEKNISAFKAQHGGHFSYVPSFSQSGGIGLPVIRTDFPPKVRRYLTDTPITSIQVCRQPISGAIDKVLNFLTIGGWRKALDSVGIDKALHLYMVLNGNTILERNHIINMAPGKAQGGAECMNVPLKGPLTFKELLQNTKAVFGPSLQRYDPRDNNCQIFLTQVLRANGLSSTPLETFINQDIKGVFEHLPSFAQKVGQTITDIAHRGDTLIHGERKANLGQQNGSMGVHRASPGRVVIREVPPDPLQDKNVFLQSVLFDRSLWTPSRAERWLRHHDLSDDDVETTRDHFRYRQSEPIPGDEYRTWKRGLREGVEFVVDRS